jgi:ABC-type phosphate/phosphonate transport system substrate-binding protein
MKNKVRVIDVSMLSSYMGRWLTVFVTIFVVAIAASALFVAGGIEKNVIRICVPARPRAQDAVRNYEPLRSLISRETRRPVVLAECAGEWPRGYDVYVMPVDDFFENEKSLDISALFELRSSPKRGDRAVVISKRTAVPVDLPSLAPGDVVFSHPHSVNGFWVQAEALAASGFELPADTTRLRFEGSKEDATRVIFGVVFGDYKLGACKQSEIASLSENGSIDARGLRVVASGDVLPETVLAAARREARYFDRKIASVAALLDRARSPASPDDTIELLKAVGVCGLERLSDDRLSHTRLLFERYGSFSRSTAAVRP